MHESLHGSLRCRMVTGVCLLMIFPGACRRAASPDTPRVTNEAGGGSLTADESWNNAPLQESLLPRDEKQAVHISIHEERVTTTHDGLRVKHEMTLDLLGTLEKAEKPVDGADGMVSAKLSLDRIQLRYGPLEPEEKLLSYDSQKNEPDEGNPLADLMQIVAGAVLDLGISPKGELVHLTGLDRRWRGADVVMAPPALLPAQWTFRNAPMQYLLAEALFPSLPEQSVAINDTWSSNDMIYIPMVARLKAETRNTLGEMVAFKPDDQTRMRYVIQRESTIGPAEPILEGRPPSLQTEVREGKQTGTLEVVAGRGDMDYSFVRRLDLAVYQVPPEGDRSPPMIIQQNFTVEAKRGREATKRVP